jgi:membrane-anchored protein YejM (alkaline phosphatase superfamily)
MDAWRADCFNKIDSPNLWSLAQKGTIFNNHSSASNHTHAGLFGLFYSIPPSYYHAFLHNQQQPIFIKRLKQLNYQLGNFSSDSLFNLFIHFKKALLRI